MNIATLLHHTDSLKGHGYTLAGSDTAEDQPIYIIDGGNKK